MRLVFNASPIICLAKAGLLENILSLAEEFVIPRPVFDEVAACRDSSDPAARWLNSSSGALPVREVGTVSPFIQAWDLGAGEASVLAFASIAPGTTAVLDDLAARRCASALRLPVIGTLGLLLRAKRTGTISSVKQALKAVNDAGLFISSKHAATICQLAGE